MDFDINTLRSMATVVSFVTFIGIVWWAWSRRTLRDFRRGCQPALRARLTGRKGTKMSDFTSNFWSIYVAGITIVSILACALLLWFSGKAKAMTASDNTTGHVWDGDLREMNNPLPRWWVWLFVITIVFALIYLVLYPGLGSFPGKAGLDIQWAVHQSEVDKGNAEIAPTIRQVRRR